LPTPGVYQAVNQAVHLAFSTRQSRKGEISSWKAFVPGFSGKLAVEAVDRAMRGEAAPSPIYEGEESVIAFMLGGRARHYEVTLPAPGERPRAILETFTKAHSAEYQAQGVIDLVIELSAQVPDFAAIEEIVVRTSHHTHAVIGTAANDPQKFDPAASRETLDHSLMYILAVALEDRAWHHEASYTRERAARPSTVALWRKIRTVEDAQWNARYHESDPGKRAFGGRIEIRLADGRMIAGEKAVADAHPNGRAPWIWPDYVGKFAALAGEAVGQSESDRFLTLVRRLPDVPADALLGLTPVLPLGAVTPAAPTGQGIFDYGHAP